LKKNAKKNVKNSGKNVKNFAKKIAKTDVFENIVSMVKISFLIIF